jgi:hypothetical protein
MLGNQQTTRPKAVGVGRARQDVRVGFRIGMYMVPEIIGAPNTNCNAQRQPPRTTWTVDTPLISNKPHPVDTCL